MKSKDLRTVAAWKQNIVRRSFDYGLMPSAQDDEFAPVNTDYGDINSIPNIANPAPKDKALRFFVWLHNFIAHSSPILPIVILISL